MKEKICSGFSEYIETMDNILSTSPASPVKTETKDQVVVPPPTYRIIEKDKDLDPESIISFVVPTIEVEEDKIVDSIFECKKEDNLKAEQGSV